MPAIRPCQESSPQQFCMAGRAGTHCTSSHAQLALPQLVMDILNSCLLVISINMLRHTTCTESVPQMELAGAVAHLKLHGRLAIASVPYGLHGCIITRCLHC